MNKKLKHKNRVTCNTTQSGFSLLLVILILSAMLITTLIISDIVLEVGRSLTKVPHSEVALYAAEAGAEKALYAFNKEYAWVDTYEVSEADGESYLEIEGSKYEIENAGLDDDIELIQENIDGTLESGGSLVLEYDLNFSTNKYDELKISFPGLSDYSGIRVSVLEFDLTGTPLAPSDFEELATSIDGSGDLAIIDWDNTKRHKVRVYNGSGDEVDYTVRQVGGTTCDESDTINCPIIGVRITSHGRYKSTERVVEVEDLKWHVF